MDRGRQRKRTEPRQDHGSQLKNCEASSEKSSERKAFEQLPSGLRPKDVNAGIDSEEIAALHKQALGQAERFEVLKTRDVEALSKVRKVTSYKPVPTAYRHTGASSS